MLELVVKLIVSAAMMMDAGRVADVPPLTAVLTSVLLSAMSLAGSVSPGARPDMATVPPRPEVLSSPEPPLARSDLGWPSLIRVPSGFTFDRKVLTLRAIFPAGAGLVVEEKIRVLPLMVMVSAVIVMVPGGRAPVPPSTAVLI